MKLTAKIAIILVCVSLCGTGAIVISKTPGKREPQKTNAIPVQNDRPSAPGNWIWT